MGILDRLMGGGDAKGARLISGEIERIGVLPGTDQASYVFRIRFHADTYYLYGGLLTQEDITKTGTAIALTVPGDQVRFLYNEVKGMVSEFENISYTAHQSAADSGVAQRREMTGQK
ncbi:hypothetical protein [Paraburkholderia sp. SIMBA_054]|uniref:hypothetical protein n=1 Tax=Paraburkholderia sp. SIMBA_054 TaxID=3085795 RepID=UPI00397E0D92